MKWFGFKSGRAAARVPLSRIALSGGNALTFNERSPWPQGYDGLVRAGYLANPIVQRAVKLVSEGVASAPLVASDPALLALVGTRSAGQALIEVIAAQLLLHGNAYVQIGCDAAGQPVELFALRPERVSVEPDASGWPVVYRYRVGERSVRLAADGARPEIVHIKAFHPLDDHYGLGCLGAAAGAIAAHNAAAALNVALLSNAARPSGALVYDPGDGSALSREQFERLKGELEASFSGAGNAGRPMLLEGGLKWQSLSLSPAEMDFAATRSAAAREIAMAFGVPPMLLGLPGDATYANYKEANRALWRLAILPVAATIFAALGQALGGWFEGASIAVDLNQVTALAEDRQRLWEQVSAADFLSGEEKRSMLGLAHLEPQP